MTRLTFHAGRLHIAGDLQAMLFGTGNSSEKSLVNSNVEIGQLARPVGHSLEITVSLNVLVVPVHSTS